MRQTTLILSVLLLAACGPTDSSPGSEEECAESAGISYRTDGRLTFFRSDSTRLRTIGIEVADSDSTRQRGLMDRRCLPDDWGMLFVFPAEQMQSFYMANTPRSLDIMYFRGDSTFINAAKYTRPNSHENVYSERPARFVVETPAGFVDRLGLSPGDFIEWTLNTSIPVETTVTDSTLMN